MDEIHRYGTAVFHPLDAISCARGLAENMELGEVVFQWLIEALRMDGSQSSELLLRFQLSAINYILIKFVGGIQIWKLGSN